MAEIVTAWEGESLQGQCNIPPGGLGVTVWLFKKEGRANTAGKGLILDLNYVQLLTSRHTGIHLSYIKIRKSVRVGRVRARW